MYKFDVKDFKINLGSIICYLGIILLFIPKINLISFEGESAGVRIDDIFVCFIVLLICLSYLILNKFKLSNLELIFYTFVLLGILSNIFNIIVFGHSNLLYSIRNVEYFVFFYIGFISKYKISVLKLSYVYIGVSAIVIILQMAGLVGGFRSEGYFSDITTRAVGLTGGPWEVGVMLMYALSIVLYTDSKYLAKAITSIVVFALLLLTGARLPTLSFFIVTGIWLYSTVKNKFLLLVGLSCTIFAFALILSQVDNPVVERSSNLFSYSNIDQFIEYYNNIRINTVNVEFPEMPVDENSDMSWLFRVSKWSYAIKYWLNSPTSYLIGLGPGIWGFALDGGWIRILTEYGIINLIIYVYFLSKIARIHPSLKMMIIVLAINMLMIDIHMAYKCMAYLYFTLGYFFEEGWFTYSIKYKIQSHG